MSIDVDSIFWQVSIYFNAIKTQGRGKQEERSQKSYAEKCDRVPASPRHLLHHLI